MASIPVKIVRICYSQLKCNYLKNLKLFLDFFLHFWNVHQIWNILKKRMIVIANVFPKVQTVKNLLRPLSKKRCFITRLNSQHVKASEIPANTPWQRFYHVFSSFSRKLIPKMVPLELGEIWVVFVNTLSGDAEYPIQDFENLLLSIQMDLSEKPKSFSLLFVPFLEYTSNFKHFIKKDDCHS